MYFSEQDNVDDDATLITIFWVSFNLQSRCYGALLGSKLIMQTFLKMTFELQLLWHDYLLM